MTEPRNPLLDRPRLATSRPAFVNVNDEQVPTDIDDYCAWLNAKEPRRGVWVVIVKSGRKTVDWREEVASPGWLQERGLVPKIGKAA